MNSKELRNCCDVNKIYNYTINRDDRGLYIDVDGDVSLPGISFIPIRFGYVSGNFVCIGNELTSLVGCPVEVGGNFVCINSLTSLEGGPKEVGGHFNCSYNKLTTLEGCPELVCGNFVCINNLLSDLDYQHLFELGYNIDNIITEDSIDLVGLRRQWVLNGIINE
jgi:hypothetical protein